MSLGVVIKGPAGMVLAADSRVTLVAQQQGGPSHTVNYDNATKLLSFRPPHNLVGAVTYGVAVIGRRTAHSFIPEFELTLQETESLGVLEYANKLSSFFMDRWQETMGQQADDAAAVGDMTFIIGGYDPEAPYGKVFLFGIPNQPEPQPRNPGENEFGMTWGGQLQIGSRLIQGYDPALALVLREELELDDQKIEDVTRALRERAEFRIPYDVLPLQDCVDLATFLIRSTMTLQGLAIGVRGVGGPIDVAVITPSNGLEYVQRKQIHGEDSRERE